MSEYPMTVYSESECTNHIQDSKNKTAFAHHLGSFEYQRKPFGFTNMPTTLQRLINQLFSGDEWKLIFYKECVNALLTRLRIVGTIHKVKALPSDSSQAKGILSQTRKGYLMDGVLYHEGSDAKDRRLLQLACLCFENLQIVVAMTSGTGKGSDKRIFSEQIKDLVKSMLPRSILMNGFTEEEAEKFLKVNNIKSKLDDVRLYCGTNS